MPQLKTFVVVNPRSANGATGRNFSEIQRAIAQVIGPFEHAFTRGPMDAAAMARDALRKGFECIVSVGGDGTTNEIVNGFFEEGRPVRPGAALGIIPRGTGGDFRKAFGWSTDLGEAAARLKGDATRPIDCGRLTFVDSQGREATRYFINIASAGVGGLVDYEVNRATKVLGGKASFMIGTLKAMLKYKDRTLRFRIDDAPQEQVEATCLAVANGQYFGGGMWVAPDAKPDDGQFDITLWSGFGLGDFVTKSKAIYDGSHVKLANTRRFKGRKVVVEADGEVLLDVDGEQPGRLPATFEIVPGALRLKVA